MASSSSAAAASSVVQHQQQEHEHEHEHEQQGTDTSNNSKSRTVSSCLQPVNQASSVSFNNHPVVNNNTLHYILQRIGYSLPPCVEWINGFDLIWVLDFDKVTREGVLCLKAKLSEVGRVAKSSVLVEPFGKTNGDVERFPKIARLMVVAENPGLCGETDREAILYRAEVRHGAVLERIGWSRHVAHKGHEPTRYMELGKDLSRREQRYPSDRQLISGQRHASATQLNGRHGWIQALLLAEQQHRESPCVLR